MSIFQRLNPSLAPTSLRERGRAAGGALLGIALTGLVSTLALGNNGLAAPLLVAPMGASAVLLFAAPASPLAQPWSILGGNVVAALIGVTCALFIPQPLLAAALAVGLAIAAMLVLNCLHPPSGAVALTAVLGGSAVHASGYWFVLTPVALNSVLLLALALAYNNLTGHRYPHLPHKTPAIGGGAEKADPIEADIEEALEQFGEVVDVSPDTMAALFRRTQLAAHERHHHHPLTGEIMSRNLLTVRADDRLRTAWRLFSIHHVKALPVVDSDGRLVGMISQADFLSNSVLSDDGNLHLGFRRRVLAKLSRQRVPRAVGDIMDRRIQPTRPETSAFALVMRMVDEGLHTIPVVNHSDRLVGVVSQGDLLAALFRADLDMAGEPFPHAAGI
ncbi:CBS domain-containing membrane protein [Rhizobium aquaticum]|uniref:CBS domain-containing membrane protein n=1 Tax=Rhizobium aquaticum TaxID=1549636 RepID=A0ABV2J4Q4_9HYPH